jgi:hypothetical protein
MVAARIHGAGFAAHGVVELPERMNISLQGAFEARLALKRVRCTAALHEPPLEHLMLDVTTIVMIVTFWTWNMLGSKPATIAVKDLNTARKFYEVVLGLRPSGPTDSSEVVNYDAGTSGLLVYRSQYAGTNKATATTWIVGEDVEGTAERTVSAARRDPWKRSR